MSAFNEKEEIAKAVIGNHIKYLKEAENKKTKSMEIFGG